MKQLQTLCTRYALLEGKFFFHALERKLLKYQINKYVTQNLPTFEPMRISKNTNPKFKK